MSSRFVEHQQCPRCAEKGEDNAGDNLAVFSDGHVHCFKCGFHPARPLSNIYSIDNTKLHSILSTTKYYSGIDYNNVDTEVIRTMEFNEDFTFEYLPLRGLTHSTLSLFNIKTKVDKAGKPVSVGFVYPDKSTKVRLLDKKEFYTVGQVTPCLFGRDVFSLGSHKYVTITEGEFDAASLYQVLRSPVVSVHSSSSAERDCIGDRDWLASFERIYLAFDNDAAGREALRKVAKLFDYNKLYVVKFDRFKDANAYLEAGLEDELRNIWWNSKRYLPETIISSFSDFKKILKELPPVGIPYPFQRLTEMTYGIRTGESVLITAQEGVGKTELMHAIEYKLLKETPYAVGAIFLEEPKRRHLQAIGGIHLGRAVHLPDSGITDDQVSAAVEEVVSQDERLHIYSHFGSDDPEILIDTIRFLVTARGCRYVLLDHITMAVSGRSEDDERRALDYIATKLEMMVVELDFALIIVSHVNDNGQTRGSRYISKIANIRIDLKRDLMHDNPEERKVLHLAVSKNRFGSQTGPAGRVVFNYLTNTYTELADNENREGVFPVVGDRLVA